MPKRIVPGSKGQTRAIVHIPRGVQWREGRPAPLARSRVEKTSRIFSFGGHCAEQYQQHSRVYIPEIPAIVLDIIR